MKQALIILGLLVLFASCELIEESKDTAQPPPFPPMDSGSVEIPWNNYGIDQKSLITYMQQFPAQYPTDQLTVLIFDLKFNGLTNMNALDILGTYTKLTDLTIDIGSQYTNLVDLGDMSFISKLTSLKKFELRAAGNQLNSTKQINQFANPSMLTRLAYDFSQNFIKDISVFQFLTTCSNLLYLTIKVNQNFLGDISILDNIKVLKNLYSLTIYSYENQGSAPIKLSFMSDFNYMTRLNYFISAENRQCNLYGHYIDTYLVNDWNCYSCYQPCSRCYGQNYDQCLDCANKNVYYYEAYTHMCKQILPNITADGKLTFNYGKSGFTDLEMRNLMQNFAQYYTDYTKIKQLYLYLNDNNITSAGVDELQQLTYYKSIWALEINLNNQAPFLSDIGQLYMTKQMLLRSFVIRLQDGAQSSVDFIKPIYKYNNATLTNLEIYLDGNNLQNIKGLSTINQLTMLQTFTGRFEGQLSDLSPLISFRYLPNIVQITFYFTQKSPLIKTDYSFLLNYNYILTLQQLKTYEGKVTICDMTQSGQYISVAADKNSWTCSQCYKYCSKCFGPAANQCIACKDYQRLQFNTQTNTCDFRMPPVMADGTVSINFNSFQIDDPLFATFLTQFQATYDVTVIKHLIFDITNNLITSFAGMSFLNKYKSIITMELSLLNQLNLNRLNYTIITDFSQKLTNLDNFILDMRECDTTNNFINVFDYGNQWKCTACTGQCQKCFGTDPNQCNSCIDNPILKFNPSTHTCDFNFPVVVSDYLYIDVSNIRLVDAQLTTFMTAFVKFYPFESFHHLNFIALCNPALTNFSSLSVISQVYTDIIDAEFQLRQYNAPYLQDITFVQSFNPLLNMTNLEMNWMQCGPNRYMVIQQAGFPVYYKPTCQFCNPICFKCFGSLSNQCTQCRLGCRFNPTLHTCTC